MYKVRMSGPGGVTQLRPPLTLKEALYKAIQLKQAGYVELEIVDLETGDAQDLSSLISDDANDT